MRRSRSESESVRSSVPRASRQRRKRSLSFSSSVIGQSKNNLEQGQRFGEGGFRARILVLLRGGNRGRCLVSFHCFEEPTPFHGIEGADGSAKNREKLGE